VKDELPTVEEATAAAIDAADYFTVSLYIDTGTYETHALRTLAQAREAARLLPIARRSHRKAMVYVITTDGRQFFVPDAWKRG
jgi:hypothetical protein